MTRKQVDRMEAAEDGHGEIHSVYPRMNPEVGIFRYCVEWNWHMFLGKGDHYVKYPALEKRDCAMGYRKSSISPGEAE